MSDKKQRGTPEYRAAQLPGSFRLKGIRVTKEDEAMASAIIRSKIKAEDAIREAVGQLRDRNQIVLKNSVNGAGAEIYPQNEE